MVGFDYLHRGICGLAHAHRAGMMAGHLGAAVAAGYFIGEDESELPDAVYRGVEGELNRVIAGEEAIWFNAERARLTPTDLFQELPQEEATPAAIPSIAAVLENNVGETRQSGHNVIFAAIALRALHDHPSYATPAAIDGISRLIQGFDGAHAGRGYYGSERGWRTGAQVELPADDGVPMYRDIQSMIDATIGELIDTAAVKKQGFGGLWHLINHAAAITELQRLGYERLADQALPAHHQHLRLRRTLPDVEKELGPMIKADHDPRDPAYWEGMLKRDEARLTHRIKTLYGFYVLRRFIQDEETRRQSAAAFLYLMA